MSQHRNVYMFGTTLGQVNDDQIFNSLWNIPLISVYDGNQTNKTHVSSILFAFWNIPDGKHTNLLYFSLTALNKPVKIYLNSYTKYTDVNSWIANTSCLILSVHYFSIFVTFSSSSAMQRFYLEYTCSPILSFSVALFFPHPYLLQPVCGLRKLGDLALFVTMVSCTCKVSCGPLAISSRVTSQPANWHNS